MSAYNRPHIYDIASDLLLKGTEPPGLDAILRRRVVSQLEFDAHLEQLPDAGNGITLNWDKRDSAGHPVMRFKYAFSEYEKAGFAHIRGIFRKVVKVLDAGLVAINGPFAHHHLMGMTRMGNDAKTSVLDRWCRTHEHKNLFVISSSAFPTGGAANPTLTIAALAIRAAEEIERQLKA